MGQARYNRRNESPSRNKGGLGARDSHFRYFDSRCNGGGPPVEVVTDHLDPAHHVLDIAGRSETKLARRIAIQQVRREHAFVDDVSPRSWQPFAVERLGAETAGNQ